MNLLARATSLTSVEDPEALALLVDLAEALTQIGELTQADDVLAAAIEAAEVAGDRAAALRCGVTRIPLQERLGRRPARGGQSAVRAAISELRTLEDDAGLVLAGRALGELVPSYGQARAALANALPHAERTGDEREQAELRIAIGKTLIFDLTPVAEAVGYIERNLEWVRERGFRKAEGECLGGLAHLYAMTGRLDKARALIAESKEIFEDFGQRFLAARFAFASASVELLAGDPAAAEREWRVGYELVVAIGDQRRSSAYASRIAQAVYAQGRHEEAEQWAEAAGVGPGPNTKARVYPLVSQGVRARVLGARRTRAGGGPGAQGPRRCGARRRL